MGLLDGLTPPIKESRCPIAKIKRTLTEEDAKLLEDAIANPKWPAAVLAVELHNRGISLTRFNIMDHRKGMCQCSKI
jgi:hypothetical protein